MNALRERRLRLVVCNEAPSTVDELFARYRSAHARWHRTKAEDDRIAARDCYNAWVVATLPPNEQAAVVIGPHAAWGFS